MYIPITARHPLVRAGYVAHAIQQQGDGMRRHFVDAVVRNVADDDSRFGSGVQIEVVGSDTVAHDDAAAPELANHLGRQTNAAGQYSFSLAAQFQSSRLRDVLGVDGLPPAAVTISRSYRLV